MSSERMQLSRRALVKGLATSGLAAAVWPLSASAGGMNGATLQAKVVYLGPLAPNVQSAGEQSAGEQSAGEQSAGEQRSAKGRLSILGFRDGLAPEGFAALGVEVVYAAARDTPVLAWGYQRHPVPSEGAPVEVRIDSSSRGRVDINLVGLAEGAGAEAGAGDDAWRRKPLRFDRAGQYEVRFGSSGAALLLTFSG